jgi:hypothetical protein
MRKKGSLNQGPRAHVPVCGSIVLLAAYSCNASTGLYAWFARLPIFVFIVMDSVERKYENWYIIDFSSITLGFVESEWSS